MARFALSIKAKTRRYPVFEHFELNNTMAGIDEFGLIVAMIMALPAVLFSPGPPDHPDGHPNDQSGG
ncbi:hypothetical protein GCM10027296_21060 [Chitinimonas naiadis]